MKYIPICILIFCFGISAHSQKAGLSEKNNKTNNDLNTTGKDQKDKWAEDIFFKEYKRHCFNRYPDSVYQTNETTFVYGKKTFIFHDNDTVLKNIFRLGIFYPQVYTVESQPKIKTEELTEMSEHQKLFYNMIYPDTVSISGLEELNLKTTIQVKRYSFLLFRKNSLNPILCFMELTNNDATPHMSLNEFINDSTLTFFKEGSILL
ncbi:hypothetical protein ACSBL2_14405 [Pedobacter sp. AW31-3R]|uniref:hypothetical protein n=1 Tax=Pedobacter sp. AW31-3R TaxID=3445781 RepID=UPI003FA0551F